MSSQSNAQHCWHDTAALHAGGVLSQHHLKQHNIHKEALLEYIISSAHDALIKLFRVRSDKDCHISVELVGIVLLSAIDGNHIEIGDHFK